MITLHRIFSAFLFLTILKFFIATMFFEMLWKILNLLHYKHFWSFEIPEIPSLDEEQKVITQFILRLFLIFYSPIVEFFNNLKNINSYQF